MDRREELTLLASADLDEAASAWTACGTLRALFAAQPAGGTVGAEQYEIVARRLADEFDRTAAAFRRSADGLRREEARRFGPAELADPQPLVYAIAEAGARGLPVPLFEEFARQLAGASSPALLDRPGLAWLVRFLGLVGYEIGSIVVDASARSYVPASAAQAHVLRALFAAAEGGGADAERRLAGFLAGRYEIEDAARLDELTAWKAIVWLRQKLMGQLSLAA